MELSNSAINEISGRMPTLKMLLGEPMSTHCSFHIGGEAFAMAFPSSRGEVEALSGLLLQLGIKPLIIGNGTNLLVTDDPLQRFVIKTGENLSGITFNGEAGIAADCGVSLARIANFAASKGLSGMEFAHGIPGTLGGAVSMNAGAYGGEMKDVVVSTFGLDAKLKKIKIAGPEHKFEYRRSVFSGTDTVILGCELNLTPGDRSEISGRMKELAEKRRNSQPLDKPSAGSTFKRPKTGYAAALIEQSGLKGFGIGGAQVSDKHSGFIVNRGGATFKDVIRLIDYVMETVLKKTGVELELEIKIIEN